MPFNQFEWEASQGTREKGALHEIDNQTRKDKGGPIGSVMVSDTVFLFRDGLDEGTKEGITANVQQGGFDRDHE